MNQMTQPLAFRPVDDTRSLRLSLDMLSGCPGSCSGCGLTDKMAVGEGFWGVEQREQTASFVNDWIARLAAEDAVDATKLYFGRGDYMGLSEEQYQAIDAFFGAIDFSRLTGGRYVVFSSSCLLKADRVQAGAQRLSAIAAKHGFEVIFEKVVDITKLTNPAAADLYKTNIQTLTGVSGWTDIAAQIGPAVLDCGLSPAQAYAAIKDLGADLLEVTLVPNTSTRAAMGFVWGELISYIDGLYTAWEADRSFELAFARAFLDRGFDHLATDGSIADYLTVEARRHKVGLHIDHDMNVAPYHTGLGKIIAASPATGFAGLGMPLGDALDLSLQRNARRMAAAPSKFAACSSCERRNQCVAVGGGVYLSLLGEGLGTDGAACPLGWKSLLERVDADNEKADFGYQLVQTAV